MIDVAKVTDVAEVTPKKRKSRLQSADHTNPHLDRKNQFLKESPLPKDIQDPVEWAAEHLEKQIPIAAKELEYQLKFGDDRVRRELALEVLSFKGITKKNDANQQVVPAIQLIMQQSAPWTQVTISNDPKKELVEGVIVPDKDQTKE